MCYQERNALISLASALLVSMIFVLYGYFYFTADLFQNPEAGSAIGRTAFVMIGVSIVVKSFVHAILTGLRFSAEDDDTSLFDERDKMIALQGMQLGFYTFSIGFLSLMAFLALGVISSNMVILLTIAFMYLAAITAEGTKLYLYRKEA